MVAKCNEKRMLTFCVRLSDCPRPHLVAAHLVGPVREGVWDLVPDTKPTQREHVTDNYDMGADDRDQSARNH